MAHRTQRLAVLVLLGAAHLLVGSPSARAEEDVPGPSFRDVLDVPTLSDVRISPDGGSAVYVRRTSDWEANRYDSEIWLVREGRPPFQLTDTREGSSTHPRYSPDGRWIAFLADRSGTTQIHRIDPRGGEAQQVSHFEGNVGRFAWSPEGRWLAASVTPTENEALEEREEKLGRFAEEDADFVYTGLWLIEASAQPGAKPKERQLVGGDLQVGSFSWAPQGDMIAFDHTPTPQVDDFPRSTISRVKVSDGEILQLLEPENGPHRRPLWSPDGRWVLFSSVWGENPYYGNSKLLVVTPDARGTQVVTPGFDESIQAFDWNDAGIWFLSSQRTERPLFWLDHYRFEIHRLPRTPKIVRSASLDPTGQRIAYIAEDERHLPEVHLGSVEIGAFRATNETSVAAEWSLGEREVVRWTSHDDTPIEGVLFKPPGHDPTKRAPLLVVIHGGPTGTSRPVLLDRSVYPIAQWLARGCLVLMPNYRGSAGYGLAFRAMNVRNLGIGDAWDVLSGVDHLVEQGLADPARLGAMGWSQGGYISAFLATTSDRFRAISNGAGISDWMTYYVNTDIHGFTREYLEATPWDDPEIYRVTSPIHAIRDATTPTLIQHGEHDRRVPLPNAYELYQGLRDVGVPTRLIVYKDFGHGINRPKERLAAMQHNWEWFEEHLFSESADGNVD